jgi:hypothetical protein
MMKLTVVITDEPIAALRGSLPDLLISIMHAALEILLGPRTNRGRLGALALREVTVGQFAT